MRDGGHQDPRCPEVTSTWKRPPRRAATSSAGDPRGAAGRRGGPAGRPRSAPLDTPGHDRVHPRQRLRGARPTRPARGPAARACMATTPASDSADRRVIERRCRLRTRSRPASRPSNQAFAHAPRSADSAATSADRRRPPGPRAGRPRPRGQRPGARATPGRSSRPVERVGRLAMRRRRPPRAGLAVRGAGRQPWPMRSITVGSASVVTSPRGRFSATSRSSRRMILPERVLGSSATIRICRGLAIGPISWATCARSSAPMSSPTLWPGPQDHEGDDALAGGGVGRAHDGGLGDRSGGTRAPTRPRSWRCGGRTTFMTSSTRPSSQIAPSLSSLAPSPAK